MSKDYIIEAKGITKAYGKHAVLAGIDLHVKKGAVFALLGPNGAGKTTMVRILSTLLRPDAGKATIAGYDVVHEARQVHSIISLTGQYTAVDEALTGEENLIMIGTLCGMGSRGAKARTTELLAQFDLTGSAKKLAKTYSGGMRRRLDLAMSLVISPQVIFLDEPTTGLDPRSRKVMWEIIAGLTASGTTIFLTTQYLEEADQLADDIAVIDGGVIVARGTPAELKQSVGSQYIELTFAAADQLSKAQALFDDKTLLDPAGHSSLRVITDGSVKAMKTVLDRLYGAAIEPTTVALKEPSMDDVFFALTGKEAPKKEQSDEK